jgi:hypothetical protein
MVTDLAREETRMDHGMAFNRVDPSWLVCIRVHDMRQLDQT